MVRPSTPPSGKATLRPPPSLPVEPPAPHQETTPERSLDALSVATDRYRRVNPRNAATVRPSFGVALLASVVVGAAIVLASGFDYRCSAILHIEGEKAPQSLPRFRNELLAFAWEGGQSAEPAAGRGWFVETLGLDRLRFGVYTSHQDEGNLLVRDLAERFCRHMERSAAETRRTPSRAETVLADYVAELQERLDEAQVELDGALEKLPDADPIDARASLTKTWRRSRDDFAGARQRLRDTAAEIAQLKSTVEPGPVLVPPDVRRHALEADAALQQDLRELVVNLTEVKRLTLDGWQRSVPPLEQLRLAANTLVEITKPTLKRAASAKTRKLAAGLVTSAESFRDGVNTFADDWNRQFRLLERMDPDPLSAAILTQFQHITSILDGHVFESQERLAEVRKRVRALSRDPSDDARHHVFLSDLTRAFQSIPAVANRFEFAARDIEPSNNFRLDAALKAAQGLNQRSAERIAAIDARLVADATGREREERRRRLAETEALIERLRAEASAAVDALLRLQDELNEKADESDAFAQAVLRTEVAAGRLEQFQDELRRTRRRIDRLATERETTAAAVSVRMGGVEPVEGPINLTPQLTVGGVGLGLTFLVVLGGQWWIIRRSGGRRIV